MTERIIIDSNGRKHITNEPLLRSPPQRPWVGLSLTEQADCYANAEDGNDFYKAIEAKLKEKND